MIHADTLRLETSAAAILSLCCRKSSKRLALAVSPVDAPSASFVLLDAGGRGGWDVECARHDGSGGGGAGGRAMGAAVGTGGSCAAGLGTGGCDFRPLGGDAWGCGNGGGGIAGVVAGAVGGDVESDLDGASFTVC